MSGKAKSRCHLGMLKVNKLRQSYLNVMKLENYGPKGECLNNNHLTSQKLYFSVFYNNFLRYKRYKNGKPHFRILNKNQIKYYIYWCWIKSWQISSLPQNSCKFVTFSFMTFLIKTLCSSIYKTYYYNLTIIVFRFYLFCKCQLRVFK